MYFRGKFDDALKIYQPLTADASLGAEAGAGVVRCLLKQEKIDEAKTTAEAGLQHFPNAAEAHVAEGEVLYRFGDFVTAEQQFIAALKIDPKNARAYYGLVKIDDAVAYEGRAWDESIKAHELDPEDPEIREAWMRTLSRKERIDELKRLLEANNADKVEQQDMRHSLDFLEKRQAGPPLPPCKLTGKVQNTSTKMERLMYDPTRLLGWGLDVLVNGKKLKLLIDTGASGILITQRAAERANVSKYSDFLIGGIGDKGPRAAYAGFADSIRVGEMEFQNCMVQVTNANIEDHDGLIGANIFSHYLVDLDFANHKLQLSPLPKRPDDKDKEDTGSKLTLGENGGNDSQDAKVDAGREWRK